MKPVTIRISDDAIKAAEAVYGAKVTGCQVAVSGFFEIQKRTLKELQGYFTEKELMAIADNMNGTMLVPAYQANTQMFWMHLQDGNEYEGLFAKWGLVTHVFQAKIEKLTAAQTYFIQDAAARFWEGSTEPKDLQTFVNMFS